MLQKITLRLFAFFVLSFTINRACAQQYDWAKSFSHGYIATMATDNAGNVFIAGSFADSMDFDPGPGVAMLYTAAGGQSMFIARYDAHGNYVWARAIGTGLSAITGIAVDGADNTYITGMLNGTVDFDPGPGVASLTTAGAEDIFFAKYDAAGNYAWAHSMGSTDHDDGNSIAVDRNANVYVMGTYTGPVDFDPGAGVASMPYSGTFFAKYDTYGNYVWAKTLVGTHMYANCIRTDTAGHLYITGRYENTVDFDPAAFTTANLTSAGYGDVYFARYDTNGVYNWARDIGGTNDEVGYSIASDDSLNVYVTGYFRGITNFNPAGSSYYMATRDLLTGEDIFIAKYNPSGGFMWAKKIEPWFSSEPRSQYISVDRYANVYVCGTFSARTDFDPGADSAFMTPQSYSGADMFFAKYDLNGNYLWAHQVKHFFGANGTAIIPDRTGSIYISGTCDTVDLDFGPDTALAPAGTFFAKYNGCSANFTRTNVSCYGGSNGALSVAVGGGTAPFTYSWAGGATTPARTGLGVGIYTVSVTSANGCSVTDSIAITQPTPLHDTMMRTPACGAGTGAASIAVTGGTAPYHYLWSTGDTTAAITGIAGGTVSPYTVHVTDSNGCTALDSIRVIADPAITITATRVNENCHGGNTGSVTLAVTGGMGTHHYLWSGGSTGNMLTGIAAGTYTATVTDSLGCTGHDTATITEPSALTATIGATPISCHYNADGALTVTAGGGTAPYAYSWGTGATAATITALPAGIYSVTVTDANSCTTTATRTLTAPPAMDTAVAQAGNDLTAHNTTATYQWVDCGNGYAPVAGATGRTFTPTANGTYAVVVTRGACSDTSACHEVSTLATQQLQKTAVINVYPNPATDELVIANAVPGTKALLLDIAGRQMADITITATATVMNIGYLAGGSYILRLTSPDGNRQNVQVTKK